MEDQITLTQLDGRSVAHHLACWHILFLTRNKHCWRSGVDANTANTSILPDTLKLACRRGDLLAALQQETHGDLSNVGEASLRQVRLTVARLLCR